MGAFIAKQPNGLYCRFSSVVDTITHYNMTEQDYIDFCVERAKEEAEKEARKVLKYYLQPFELVKESFIPNNMTEEEFENLLKEMSERKE